MSFHKTILIFGGSGSLGNALINKWIADSDSFCYDELWSVSRNERSIVEMRRRYGQYNAKFMVADIRDYTSVEKVILQCRPHTIIIAAALKHIDICEEQPDECIKTNIQGVQNIVNAVLMNREKMLVECVINISTDKACNPINVYGMSKAIGERIIVHASKECQPKYPVLPIRFMNVRYGNVLLSSGSVIPLFKKICEDKSKPAITVTNPKMSRFFMDLDASLKLIDTSIKYGNNGETWVATALSMYIGDIAAFFSTTYNKPIVIIGERPGEKAHEELINKVESLRTVKRHGYTIIKRLENNTRNNELQPNEWSYSSDQHTLSSKDTNRLLSALLEPTTT